MYIRRLVLGTLCSVIMFNKLASANDISIYRWVDKNNVVHFSQHQPQHDNYSQLTTLASYRAKRQANNPPSPVDDELPHKAQEQTVIDDNNKNIAEKNCKTAKYNIKTLNLFSKVTTVGSDGKKRVLTDKEKKSQIILSNKHIKLYCHQNTKS